MTIRRPRLILLIACLPALAALLIGSLACRFGQAPVSASLATTEPPTPLPTHPINLPAPALTETPQPAAGPAPALAPDAQVITWPAADWQAASPESQGLDPIYLAALEVDAHVRGSIHSLLVVRHGFLVLEYYADGYQAGDLQALNSCTKSLTSALVGIALEQGYLPGVDQSVLSYFPDKQVKFQPERKQRWTLQHLLTMSTGLTWPEWAPYDANNPFIQMTHTQDWVQFVLNRPLEQEPGRAWNYNTGGSQLLAAILERATGESEADYARAHLFDLLGIGTVIWPKDPDGVSYGGFGVQMTGRDMARFGYLYLRLGEWQGRQVVPAQWVRDSTQSYFSAKFDQGYGYHWWIEPFGGFTANGYGGQRILVLPAQDLVVVFTASLSYPDMQTVPEEMVEKFLLPAVR